MNRAYGVIDVKSVDEDQRIISGVASSVATDRMGDIVESKGARFSLPMPLLWQHKHEVPVGWVEFADRGDKHITFRARIANIVDPGPLKDAVDMAWSSVKAKLVRGVSIGFKAIEAEPIDKKDPWSGVRFKAWEWLELSLVTIPANSDASIQTIRSIDAELLAASGTTKPVSSPPGVTGKQQPKPKGLRAMKTISEQLADWTAKRAATAAQMESIMSKAAEDGLTLTKDQEDEYDGMEAELEQIDRHIKRLRGLEKTMAERAAPVDNVRTVEDGAKARAPEEQRYSPIFVARKAEPGVPFARYIMAMGVAKAHGPGQALAFARRWRDQTPEVELAIKAAVDPGLTTDATWAAPLVYAQNLASEFAEYLRPLTILGRIPGLRRVPFNTRIPRQTQTSTVGWVGESNPKPVSELAFDSVSLTWAKIAGIVTFSKELQRLSSPGIENLVRDDLANSIVQFQDQQFLDPDKSAVANVSPASITAGVTPIQASGTTADALRADLGDLFATYLAANLGLGGTVIVMSSTLASYLSMMVTSLSAREFPDITPAGGTLLGMPVIVSENISTGMLIMIKASEILVAEDPTIEIDVSEQASVQMDSAPTAIPTTSTIYRSLWQMNEIGVRAEKFITWGKRRTGAVQYIANAGYGGAPGGSGT